MATAAKLRLIILGAPGSGKGTISKRLVKSFRLAHLSTGDILRDNINKKTPLGIKTQDNMAKGQLLADDVVTKMLSDELKKVNEGSWLLDGYPRTLPQAHALNDLGVHLDRVLNLNVPKDVIINRLSHRWIHPASGRVYNLEFNPPKAKGRDDITGEALIQRPDDHKDVVLSRLKTYEQQIKPLLDYYSSKNLLETFTGDTSDYLWPLIHGHVYALSESQVASTTGKMTYLESFKDPPTHTGQKYDVGDYRRVRFSHVEAKEANPNFAIDLVAQDPVVVADQRFVWSSSGGALGHPRVYINLDRDEVHDCGYSGRRFIQKKFYDEKKHGKSISFEAYLEDMERRERNEL